MPEPSTAPKPASGSGDTPMKLGGIDLKKKMGPLPIWAWGLIAGSIIGLYLYSRHRGGEDTFIEDDAATELEDASVEEGVGEGPGWETFPPPTTPSPAAPDTYTNNREWAAYAINITIQQTDLDNAAIATAVGKFIAKQPLTQAQVDIIGIVIGLAGAPPNPLQIIRVQNPKPPGGGGGGNPPPNKPPRPTPGDSKWHMIRSKKESLAGLNRRYYAHPEARQGDIFRANRKGANRPGPTKGWMNGPDDIRVGKWLYIPGPTKNRHMVK